MGRESWDVPDKGYFSQFVDAAPGRVDLVRSRHLRVRFDLGVSERIAAIGNQRR